ncbi:MAG: leucine-rich repeat domain-containing protein [Kofleriaceae bacterium]|nr:leucine-rich repeat domain-containing protein [Kofleriaceae bacterium]
MGFKPRMSPDDWAVKLGKEDAQSALDSGDYGYHKMETGLSTLGLIDDYWSTHEENAEVWFGLSAKTALGRSYRKAFRGRIAELNKKPSLDGENDVIKKISDGVRKADGLYNCYDYSLHIPAEIAGMKSITTVWLRKMRFADEDVETIFTFPNVKIANLDENRIKKVSANIANWKSVKDISIGMNPLKDISALCGLGSLEILRLGHNRSLASLPAAIGSLRALRYLDLAETKLVQKTLPTEFAELTSLTHIRVSDNCPKEFRSEIRASHPKVKFVSEYDHDFTP